MKRFRRLYLWFYDMIKGHLPPGTLIRFNPPSDRNGIYWYASGDPPLHSLGIVIGGWRAYKRPGFMHRGSVVMIGAQVYDVDDLEIEVIDERG